MAGTIQKIKDALTPGHKETTATGTTAYDAGYNADQTYGTPATGTTTAQPTTMQKIKNAVTPGHQTAGAATTSTAYPSTGTGYNTTGTGAGTYNTTDPAYGTGTTHNTAQPGLGQKIKNALTPDIAPTGTAYNAGNTHDGSTAAYGSNQPTYGATSSPMTAAGYTTPHAHDAQQGYGTGMGQPTTMEKIKDAVTPGHNTTTTGTGAYNTGTGYSNDPAYGTAAHKPTMMEKVKEAVTGQHPTATTTGTGYNTDQTYGTAGTTTTGQPTMMEKVKDAVIPGRRAHRHKTRYNADGTILRRNSNSSSSSSSDDESRREGNVCNVRKFTEVEDRAVLKERVEHYVEHVPVEKQFVVETRPIGEKVMTSGITIESKGITEKILDRVTGQTCPAPGIIEKAMGVQGTPASTVTYDKCAGGRC